MSRDLTGKVIVITGASSGIGAATAIECARAGMDVALCARRMDRLKLVAEEIRRLGRRAHIVCAGVTDEGMPGHLLDQTEHALGRCDVVFANAGHAFSNPLVEVTEAQLREIFEVNFFAGFRLLQEAARRWIAAKQPGHLLMCSSCLAKFALPFLAPYSATKAAQNHLCGAMRIELEPHGIEVASVHPITTTTEFFEVARRLSGHSAMDAVPDHAPKMFVQPPQRVGRAVVQCLRKPRSEVWTSFIVRAGAAMMTLWPSLHDMVMRKTAKLDRAQREATLKRGLEPRMHTDGHG